MLTAKLVVSRCAFSKLQRDFGFFCSVNYLSGGGVIMQITMQRACPARPPMTPDSSRIAKEFAVVRRIFVHIFNSEG